MKFLGFLMLLLILQGCNEIPRTFDEPGLPPVENDPESPIEEEVPEDTQTTPEQEPSEEETTDPPSNIEVPLYRHLNIPIETEDMVSVFIFYSQLFGHNLTFNNLIIEFDTTSSGTYFAYCSKVNNNLDPKITINHTNWIGLNAIYREQLLFHELGHCLLNRNHLGSGQNPVSIMNSNLFNSQIYVDNYDSLIEELFNYEDLANNYSYQQYYPYLIEQP